MLPKPLPDNDAATFFAAAIRLDISGLPAGCFRCQESHKCLLLLATSYHL